MHLYQVNQLGETVQINQPGKTYSLRVTFGSQCSYVFELCDLTDIEKIVFSN